MLEWLNRLRRRYHLVIALVLTGMLGYIDYVTGYDLRMELFYVLPIAYAAWFVGQRAGIGLSILSLITAAYADIMAGKKYANFAIEIWNGAMYLVFYLIVILLVRLHKTYQQRESLLETLDEALKRNEELSSLLPICSNCRKLRDDPEYVQQVKAYVSKNARPDVMRGLCKECADKRH